MEDTNKDDLVTIEVPITRDLFIFIGLIMHELTGERPSPEEIQHLIYTVAGGNITSNESTH